MAQLTEHGLEVPATATDQEQEPSTDHLADIHTVLRGETRVRTQIVLRRLADLNPAEYDDWTFQDLSEALAAGGIAARKSDGVMVVRTADTNRALAERDKEEDDDEQ
jgi:DNA segregation ATPase FtsK/SpoIIIE, S-DNA-T family